MKCHLCKKELSQTSAEHSQITFECPDSHALVKLENNQIVHYSLLWDADSNAKERYWIDAFDEINSKIKIARFNQRLKHQGTTIYKSTYGSPYKYFIIMEISNFIPLQINNDVICINNIVERISKLKAFI